MTGKGEKETSQCAGSGIEVTGRAGEEAATAAGRPASPRAARTLRSPTLTCYDRRRELLGPDQGHRQRIEGSRRFFCPMAIPGRSPGPRL